MKKVFYFLLVAMFCGVFVGCSKDDAGEVSKDNYEKAIVGTWNLYKDWEEGEYCYYEEGEWSMSFKSDGSGYFIDGDDRWELEWEIDGSSLFVLDFDTWEENKATIKKLTKTELVLSYYGGEYLEYYKRAN